MRASNVTRVLALAAVIAMVAPAMASVKIDSATFGGLRARAIGPAVMSGRISALDAVAEDPVVIWAGTATGGLWKSKNAGVVFEPVFDDYTQSIGSIAIDPNDSDVVWVGTGETWVRNSVSVGEGMFRTTDGGETWEKKGLEKSERISKILVDPNDSDTVYACVLGHLWNPNPERGVYKTTDAGETWEMILEVDENTGCADMDMDPQEPNILYAAMWEFRRYPDFFTSGGPGSGLHRSLDGGETWTQLTNGLPDEELGRIAVAVAPSRPSTVYATVEAETTALYRSDDLGENWRMMDDSSNVQMRPFYFSELVIDPTDHTRVYKPGFTLTVSTDGGDTFSSIFGAGFSFGSVHSDHHALWINPKNPHMLVLGTDGGAYVSYDRANQWRHVRSLPVSQFYHVSADNEWPYNVYGGLQDNGSWKGPSRSAGGITGADWQVVGGGDGFWAFADPNDANTLYVEYQGGQLSRVNMKTGESKSIKPYATEDQEKLRFNWNTPIHLSPTQAGTLYFGSQYVHKSTDRGESWESISPDLTTDDPQRQRQEDSGGISTDNTTAENNATIYAIAESPKNPQVVWIGTDDGLVHVTQDGGETWTALIDNIPGVPAGTWVSSIAASPYEAAEAYITFDGHRTGDMAAYVYKTTDFGATWTSLVTDQIEGYCWTVEQDPVNPAIVYLGTEFGLYITLDGGGQWARFTENLPRVAVHDLVVHPTEHDLILGTHGRGVYIIDDLTALRGLTTEILESNVAFLPSRPSPMIVGGGMSWFGSDDEFVGANPTDSASISYYLKRRHLFGDLKLEVFDEDGELITTIPGRKRKGLNRVPWPMRLKPPKVPPATALVPTFQGPRVMEGTYKVVLTKGKEVLEGEVQLVPDPRNPHPKEDRIMQQKTALHVYGILEDLTFLSDTVTDLRDQARERAENLRRRDKERLEAFADDLDDFNGTLAMTEEGGIFAGKEELRERLGDLYGGVSFYDGKPTASQMKRLEILEGQFEDAKATFEEKAGQIEALNALLARRDAEPLNRMSREDWEAKNEGGGAAAFAAPQFMHGLLSLTW